MIRHKVTVTTTSYGFAPGASHRAACATCGWRGRPFTDGDRAGAEARLHGGAARPVFDLAMQAAADADGEAAELRHRALCAMSAAVTRAVARTRALGRIDAALGGFEHQEALDAEIDRHLVV